VIVVEIPGLTTVSETNAHENHWHRVKRVRIQHDVVLKCLDSASPSPPALPVVVTLTRLSSGTLDTFDNLPSSLKHVADAVAWWLRGRVGKIGQADRNESEIRFVAAQEKTRRGVKGVRVTIAQKGEEAA
jgi:hypothetical protein